MNLWQSLEGKLRLQLLCADVPGFLNRAAAQGFRLEQVSEEDEVTVSCRISSGDWRRFAEFVRKQGGRAEILSRNGIIWNIKSLLRRPVLWGGMMLILFLSLFLPSRILFVRVEGAKTIPSRYISSQASDCGIYFGASRRAVRSEKVKNALLEKIPELQWAGVNTQGCTAVISVRERTEARVEAPSSGVSRIAACRDAVISSCTVTRGTALCAPGQAVKAGQTLVSGYTDCGLQIKAQRACGEIFGHTQRTLQVVTPAKCRKRGPVLRNRPRYALIIGKKRINFYNNSGIIPTGCDKIYKEYCLTLPGGFALPVQLTAEWACPRESMEMQIPESQLRRTVESFTRRYLPRQMLAGTILSQQETFCLRGELGILTGSYACREQIGQEQSEEILQ